jgi:hypothetical protein
MPRTAAAIRQVASGRADRVQARCVWGLLAATAGACARRGRRAVIGKNMRENHGYLPRATPASNAGLSPLFDVWTKYPAPLFVTGP